MHVDAAGQRVALIVIQKEVVVARRREVREAAGDAAAAFDELVRIGHMGLERVTLRRTERRLEAADSGFVDGEREKDVRIPNRIVVEEVPRVRAEVVGIDRPAVHGYRHADFILIVAFAFQRKKPEPLVDGDVQERARRSS